MAAALCRAYNRWLVEFCSAAPDRLVGVPHISLADLDEGVREVRGAARAGLRGVFVRPDLVDDKPIGHPDLDPFATKISCVSRSTWIVESRFVGSLLFSMKLPMTHAAFAASACKAGKWSSRSRSDALMRR